MIVILGWQHCWTRVHNTWLPPSQFSMWRGADFSRLGGSSGQHQCQWHFGVQVFQKHCISRFLHILYILHTFHILHILYKTAYREVGAHYWLKCSTYSTYSVAHCSVVLVLELALCSGQSGLKVLALGEEVLPSTHQPNHQPSNCDTHQDGINGYNYKHT